MTFLSFQASKKAAAKRGKTAQRGSSNVFSMFEQSQIQEFKEVGLLLRKNDQLFILTTFNFQYKTFMMLLDRHLAASIKTGMEL